MPVMLDSKPSMDRTNKPGANRGCEDSSREGGADIVA